MSRPVLWLLLAAGALLLLAACGGEKTYSLAGTRACLHDQPGVRVSSKTDFVASTAPGGALTAKLADNQVTISFGTDADEAGRIATAYRRFRGRNIGIEDVLRPRGNAVLLWAAHPLDADEATIHGCLK